MNISANEVKQKGVGIFAELLQKFDELTISVRGKQKYVVLDIERYNEFRKNELDLAYMQVKQDIEEGNSTVQSAKEHMEELKKELNG